MPLYHRLAKRKDIEVLARNSMTVAELAERMRGWLETDYCGSIFEDDSDIWLMPFTEKRRSRSTFVGSLYNGTDAARVLAANA